MSAPPFHQGLIGTITEREWQAFVTNCLTVGGWHWYHTHDSRRSPAGFPDIIAVKGDRMLALELKTTRGKLRPEQADWLAWLAAVPGVKAGVLRPQSWQLVLELTGLAERIEGGSAA